MHRIVVVIIAGLLAACYYPPTTNMLETEQPAHVEIFRVVDEANSVLWEVRPRGNAAISEVTYGIVPGGYEQTSPAQRKPRSLRDGERLYILTVTKGVIFCRGATVAAGPAFSMGYYSHRPRTFRGRHMTSEEEQAQIAACSRSDSPRRPAAPPN